MLKDIQIYLDQFRISEINLFSQDKIKKYLEFNM